MLEYKGEFIESLSDEELDKGLVKVFIPDPDGVVSGESIWGYLDRTKYTDKDKSVRVILLNNSFCYIRLLNWGTEIVCKNNDERFKLDVDWLNEERKKW